MESQTPPPQPTPGTSPPDLMRALGGQSPGSEQREQLESLLQAISATSQTPLYSSPWQQIGSAMAGYGAGVSGRPNPVLGQLLARREAEVNRQVQMADLRLKLQREEREQEGSIIDMYGKLATNPNRAASAMGLSGISGLLAKKGYPLDPTFKSALLFGDVKNDDIKTIVGLIDDGATLDTIRLIKPDIDPRVIAELTKQKDNPDFGRAFGLKPKEEREKEKVERERATLDLLFRRYGIDGNTPQASGIRQMAFSLYKKTFDKLTETEQKHVIDQFGTGEPVKLSDIATLRGQFSSQSKTFPEVRDAYSRIMSVARTPSYAGDIALLTSYMKLIDPTTGVKEGEFATAANAGNIDERVRAIYNRLLTTKGMLSNNQRMDFVGQAFELFRGHRDTHLVLEQQFKGIAERSKMDPRDVVMDLMGPWRTATTPTRRIQVRSKKDPRRTGWIVLRPGQALPSDVEEVE